MTGTRASRNKQMEESNELFLKDASDHEMSIIKDDFNHRHLVFSRNGSSIYYFGLVTWPGHLAIYGDMGCYVFARITDMFEFFESSQGRINPQYWSEKLQAPKREYEDFSSDLFVDEVKKWANERADEEELTDEQRSDLMYELDMDVLSRAEYGESASMSNLVGFKWESDGVRITGEHEWENSYREYDYSFLWCCWAIVWGIAKYREAKGQA
jgi:hypothetical protein